MWITVPEAINIYARFCRARYGSAAGNLVVERARQLEEKDALQGHQIWNDVAREIERLRVTSLSSKAGE
jgi:hypothetical protein